jgi:hypothetical protein
VHILKVIVSDYYIRHQHVRLDQKMVYFVHSISEHWKVVGMFVQLPIGDCFNCNPQLGPRYWSGGTGKQVIPRTRGPLIGNQFTKRRGNNGQVDEWLYRPEVGNRPSADWRHPRRLGVGICHNKTPTSRELRLTPTCKWITCTCCFLAVVTNVEWRAAVPMSRYVQKEIQLPEHLNNFNI